MRAPKKIVRQFFRCRLFETNRNAARWIHSRKDVADCTVFATGIECLQHDEKRTLLLRIHQILQSVHFLPVLLNFGQS